MLITGISAHSCYSIPLRSKHRHTPSVLQYFRTVYCLCPQISGTIAAHWNSWACSFRPLASIARYKIDLRSSRINISIFHLSFHASLLNFRYPRLAIHISAIQFPCAPRLNSAIRVSAPCSSGLSALRVSLISFVYLSLSLLGSRVSCQNPRFKHWI